MTDRIQAGDMVLVVRPTPCCGSDFACGEIFQVQRLEDDKKGICAHCGRDLPESMCAIAPDKCAFELWRLKRIPPLSELEGERTEEKLKEPA